MEEPLELLAVRHAESQFNLDGSGGFDSALTDPGREQAHRLALWLAANFKFAAFYSSTMERARQTSEIIAPALHLPVQFRDDLCEADFDIGAAMPQFADPMSAMDGHAVRVEDFPPTYVAFQSRVARAFQEIARAHDSGTILVITHGGVIATLLRTIFGAHQVSVHTDNTAATLLRWNNSRWHLVYSNRTDHLRNPNEQPISNL